MARPRASRLTTAILLVVLTTLVIWSACTGPGLGAPAATQDGISVYFSPRGGCTQAIVDQINQARKTILVQAYSFTSAPIARAMVAAHRRGVNITVVLDKENRTARYSSATFLRNQGIPVYIDARHAIAHNKIILIDGRTIITGSFNFTRAAEEHNAENLLILQGKDQIYEAYRRNFEMHLGHSEKYTGPSKSARG